jgi:hypothetical protein
MVLLTPSDREGTEFLVETDIARRVRSHSDIAPDRSNTIRLEPLTASTQALVQTPPHSNCHVCVIVPVRNEAETLQQTLNALLEQTNLDGTCLDPTSYEVILLANNCSDRSAEIARQFGAQHPSFKLHLVERVLPPVEAYIGRVRQLLMDEAYHRLMLLDRPQGIIASTDGDSQVASTWIAATRWEIEQGADAVGGRIVTDRQSRHALKTHTRRCFLQEVGYRSLIAELESHLDPDPHDPLPRHYQHYGASLAVTAETYAQAGGLPPVRTAEDEAFYQALLRISARFRHSPLVKVTTSARQTGRSPVGLAQQLNAWATQGEQPFWVEPAGAITTRLHARHHLRQLWQRVLNGQYLPQPEVASLAQTFDIDAYWLMFELNQPHTFGCLFERVEHRQQSEGHWRERWALVEIKHAIEALRNYLVPLRRA